MANTARAITFLRRDLENIGIVAYLAKTMVPPTGHTPTAKESWLVESVDVHITEEGGVTVVGVPIGTAEYIVK